jgi:UDP-N-acetyl-D-glucosamine dehydrogenase
MTKDSAGLKASRASGCTRLSDKAISASRAAQELGAKIASGSAVVGVYGLGYVGLPLSLAIFARSAYRIIGFDIDPAKVESLNAGRSYFRHLGSEQVARMAASGRFSATTDFARTREVDVALLCVPTPLNRHREPDLGYVTRTVRSILDYVRPGQLIVLESTTYPGTTRDLLAPMYEAKGLALGTDVFLAYSPEREDPGNAQFETSTIPKVVGGDGEIGRELAVSFYSAFVDKVVPVSSTACAEAVKLTENIFRAVNIALVNELKLIYSAMGIDIWEVIEAAKSKPFGYMPFYPGPGLGGHCIPIDPFYLTWKAREYDISTRFIELAGEINTIMPRLVVERLAEALDRRTGRGLIRARILIVGLAYKKNIDDLRESPSLRLIELLEARGATADFHDPFIPVIPPTREHAALARRTSVPLGPAEIANYDAVLIATDHDAVDYASLVANARLVVDTRNVCERKGVFASNVVKA